jgi:hypothetical protein
MEINEDQQPVSIPGKPPPLQTPGRGGAPGGERRAGDFGMPDSPITITIAVVAWIELLFVCWLGA